MSYSTRVTERYLVDRSLRGIQSGLTRLGGIQEKLSSGRAINRPSDDPLAANKAMYLRSEIATQRRYQDSARDGGAWLAQIDSTLSDVTDVTGRVRDLTLQGLNTGSLGDSARAALASEVDQLRNALLSQANTTYLGRPVFGGTTAGLAAFDASGTYVGDTGQVTRQVGATDSMRVDVSGTDVFGDGPTSLFSLLDTISTHLTTDPAALSGDLTQLDAMTSQIRAVHSDVGTRAAYLEDVSSRIDSSVTGLAGTLSQTEDVDVAEASVQLSLAELTYQSALAATSRSLQPSLLDFLR